MIADDIVAYEMDKKFTCEKLWFLGKIYTHLQNLNPAIKINEVVLFSNMRLNIIGYMDVDTTMAKTINYELVGHTGAYQVFPSRQTGMHA